MKHIVRLFFLIFLLGFGVLIANLNLGNGRTVFSICFILTLVIGLSALTYMGYFKKHRSVKAIILCVFLASVLSFSGSVQAEIQAAAFADSALLEKYKQDIEAFDKVAADSKSIKDYDAIMKGDLPPTFEPGELEAAQKAWVACSNTTGVGDKLYSSACDKAYKYIQIAGRGVNSLATGCSPITAIIKNVINKDSCWPCDITSLVISAIQNIAASSYQVLKDAALNLLGGLFLLWLAYVTLIFFGKFGFARISEYLTNVLNKSILVLIVAAFLHLPAVEIYKITISPFVGFSAGLAEIFSNEGRVIAKQSGNVLKVLQNVMSAGSDYECKYCKNSGYNGPTTYMDAASINSLLCIVCTVYHQVMPMISLGQGITCFGGSASTSSSDSSSLSSTTSFGIPRLGAVLTGIVMIIIFSFLMVIIAYYVITSILQLGFVIVLMPFWLVAFVFKASREYVKNAWSLVLHAMGTLISLSLNTALVMIGFSSLLTNEMALTLGWAMISGSPMDIMDSFSGTEMALENEGGEDENSSVFSGMTNKLVKYGIQQAIGGGLTPGHVMLLLLAYAMLSISMVSNTSLLVERILDAWLNREADPQGEVLSGLRTAGKGVGSVARLGTSALFFGGGYLAGKMSHTAKEIAKKNEEKYNTENNSSSGYSASSVRAKAANTYRETTDSSGIEKLRDLINKKKDENQNQNK